MHNVSVDPGDLDLATLKDEMFLSTKKLLLRSNEQLTTVYTLYICLKLKQFELLTPTMLSPARNTHT